MNLLQQLRQTAFWTIDLLRGGKIQKHYSDIALHYNQFYSEVSENLRKQYLSNLLQHASSTVPFYKDKGLERSGLESFPVVNKGMMKENYNSFLSGIYSKEKLYTTTTSGSTGTPFTIYKDAEKLKRHQADNIFFSHKAGHKIGTKLVYLRVWNDLNRKGALEQFLMNVDPVEISNLSPDRIDNIIQNLRADTENKSVLSFASALEAISIHIRENNNRNEKVDGSNFNVDCIMSMSESLSDEARNILQNFFSCPVLSRYSNMENGFVAQQEAEAGAAYYINHGSFMVELLNLENDERATDGKLGRIVITDFFNYAMPFIRYDTGDLGILSSSSNNGGRGPVLTKVEGRKVDSIYNTKNELISPHSITNTMWSYSEIKQFQFIQKSDAVYIMKINSPGQIKTEDILLNDLKSYLGRDAKITIEYVDEIPLLSSGKRKKIVNEMIK